MNIYISNMSYQTTEEYLRRAFEGFGKVSAVNILTDRESGRPNGLAFVEMPAKNEAAAAIKGLNGQRLMGRSLKVYEADQHEENGVKIAVKPFVGSRLDGYRSGKYCRRGEKLGVPFRQRGNP